MENQSIVTLAWYDLTGFRLLSAEKKSEEKINDN